MHFDNEIKDKIIHVTDIVDLIGDSLDIRKRGANYLALCPFHVEKTPSFTISPDKQIYKCFGCGVSGNAITFMMEYHKLTYPEAVKELGRRAGIVVEDKKLNPLEKKKLDEKESIKNALKLAKDYYKKVLYSTAGSKALSYLQKRGYSKELMNKFELGYAPDTWNSLIKEMSKLDISNEILMKAGLVIESDRGDFYDRFRDRVIFPILDHFGEVVGFGARMLTDTKGQAKYINSPQTLVYDKGKILYGLFNAKDEIRRKGTALLTEGYADVLALHQANFKNSIASSGTSLTKNQLINLYRYCKSLYIIFDADSAGVKAAERGLELALEHGFDVKIVKLPQGEDPDSIIQKMGDKTFQAQLDNAISFIDFMIEIYKENEKDESPMKKAEMLRNLIRIISNIPDRLQHDEYIRIIQYKLDLTARQVDEIYYEKKKYEKRFENKKLKHKRINKTIDNTENQKIKQDTLIDDTEILPAEKELLSIAVNQTSSLKLMVENYGLNIDLFQTKIGKRLFNELLRLSKTNDDLMIALFDDDEISSEYKQILTNFAFNTPKASELWKEFSNMVIDEDFDKLILQLITKLRVLQIKIQITELENQLKVANEEEQFKILNKKQKLSLERNKLLKIAFD